MRNKLKIIEDETDALLVGILLIVAAGFLFVLLIEAIVLYPLSLLFFLSGIVLAETVYYKFVLKYFFQNRFQYLLLTGIVFVILISLFLKEAALLIKSTKLYGSYFSKILLSLGGLNHLAVYSIIVVISTLFSCIVNYRQIVGKQELKFCLIERFLNPYFYLNRGRETIEIGKRLQSKKTELLYEENLKRHVHIVGGTGTGKTNLLKNIIESKIKLGESVIFLDMKADKSLLEWVQSMHEKYGRDHRLKLLSTNNTDESTSINPVKREDFFDIKDLIMNSIEWSEPYYKSQASLALNLVIDYYSEIRFKYKKYINISDIENLLTSKELFEKLEENFNVFKNDNNKLNEFISFLYSKEGKKDISGLISNLVNIKFSEIGRFLATTEPLSPSVREITFEDNFLFIQLNAMKNRESSVLAGKLLLNDIINSIGFCNANGEQFSKNSCSIIIDEASDFFTEDFIHLPNKSRSSGVQLVVAHQILADLNKISDSFAKRFMGNMGTKIFFGTIENEEPELIAASIGTQKTFKKTNVFENNTTESFGSIRETDEFIIHPNVIRNLKIGEVIMIRRLFRPGAFKIKIKLASEKFLKQPLNMSKISEEQKNYHAYLMNKF